MRTETQIIDRIWSRLPTHAKSGAGSWLRLGVGDDAAVLRGSGSLSRSSGLEWVLSTDAFLEGIHFLASAQPPESIGYKALARATSDLAAMGATPRFFMLSLALPVSRTGKWLDDVLTGLAQAARKFGMVLIGGDTSQFPSAVFNVTVGGQLSAGRALTRSGARPGDGIYVTGKLGAAQLGLELVLRKLQHRMNYASLLPPLFYPKPQLGLGQWLSQKGLASAAIDTSDGLSTDLRHLCRSSRVGARLWLEKIPKVQVPDSLRGRRGFDPLELALHGGEDYQLLFTVPKRAASRLPHLHRGTRITQIGEIARGHKLEIIDPSGRTEQLQPQGWDHFRSAR